MRLTDLLNEVTYSMYKNLVYVEFSDETNITDIAQLIRGLRYVTVVNNKTDKEDLNPRGLLQLKVVTLKPGQETFELIKKEAMATIPTLKKFKYSTKQLQKIEEIYSYSEEVDVSWVRILIIGYVTFISAIIISNYFDGPISNVFFNFFKIANPNKLLVSQSPFKLCKNS